MVKTRGGAFPFLLTSMGTPLFPANFRSETVGSPQKTGNTRYTLILDSITRPKPLPLTLGLPATLSLARRAGTSNPGPDLVYELIGLILRFRLGLYASQDNSTPSHQGGL